MRYIVITSKHHDGFGLWDSDVSDYDVFDASPFDRDSLRELCDAADREGIPLGFYHSIMDWHHPDAQAPHYPTYNTSDKSNPDFSNFVENYLIPQVRDLVVNYDPAVLWFDGEWIPEWTHEMGLDLYNMVRSLKPEILINNRMGDWMDVNGEPIYDSRLWDFHEDGETVRYTIAGGHLYSATSDLCPGRTILRAV